MLRTLQQQNAPMILQPDSLLSLSIQYPCLGLQLQLPVMLGANSTPEHGHDDVGEQQEEVGLSE